MVQDIGRGGSTIIQQTLKFVDLLALANGIVRFNGPRISESSHNVSIFVCCAKCITRGDIVMKVFHFGKCYGLYNLDQ